MRYEPDDELRFTIYHDDASLAGGPITGFTLELEGDERDLKRVMDAAWREMMRVSADKQAARAQPTLGRARFNYDRFPVYVYDGPRGELHVRRRVGA